MSTQDTQDPQDRAPATNSPILTIPDNITIRPYHSSDAPSLSHHGNTRAVWNNLRNRMPHPYTSADARSWIEHCNSPSASIPTGPYIPDPNPPAPTTADKSTLTIAASGPASPTTFAIVVGGEPCGSIGLDFATPWDVYARSAEIGYWLGEAYWGQGIMSAVVPAFVAWSWRTFGVLVRMNAEVDAANVGSRKALQRAGFVVEGRREKALVKEGELRDVVLLGALRPEGKEVEMEGS